MLNYVSDDFIVKSVLDDNPPRAYTASGYGSKLPTSYRVKCTDNRTRRVYVMIYSNSGTAYILVKGKQFIIHDYQITEKL